MRRHGAVATFCIVTDKLPGNEELVRQVVAAGMRICDPSRTHDQDLPTRPLPRITDEVAEAQADLATAADTSVGYLRAPGGNWSPDALRIAAAHRMQPLGWSVDSRDWRRPGVPAIVAAVQEQVHPGAVVLLHDGGGRRDQTAAALEQLPPWLTKQGYRFGYPTP